MLSWYCINTNKPEEYIELLKTSDIDPSFDCNWSIWWASINGHIEIVKYLLNDPRVDPTTDGNYPIEESYRKGHKEIVRLLLNDKRVISKLSKYDIDKYTYEIS